MEDGDLFCPNCGKKVESSAPQPAQNAGQAEQPSQSVNQAEQSAPQTESAAQQTTVAVAEAQKQDIAQPAPPINPYAQQQPQQNPYTQQQKPQQNPYAQQPQSQQNPYAQQPQPQQNPYAQQQNPYAAPNAQQQFTAPKQKKSNFKITKPMIIIGSVVLAVIIVAVILICILISNANNPVNKMIDAINSGDYKSAEMIYFDNYAALNDNQEVIDAIQKQVDAVESDYKNGTIDYDTAMDKLDDISDLPMAYDTTLSNVKSEMYYLKESAEYMEKGDEYLKDKDYSSAIYYYEQVSKKDTANYSKAQEQKAKAIDGIRQKYLDEAKDYAEQNKYAYAVSSLQSGLESTYLKNDSKLSKQIDAYVDEVIKKSNEYAAAKDYENAVDIVENMTYAFDRNSDSYKKLEEQLSKIETERPDYLYEMDINNYDYFYRYQSGSRDVVGNVYNSDNVCTMAVSKYYKDPYAEMYVKDYKKVKGTLAVKQTSGSIGDITAHIEILDDDNKVLYKSETFTGKSKPVDFELNITDVEWLTIKLVNTKPNSNGTMNVILADVEFYKTGSSEPDAPAAEPSKPESSKAESSNESSKEESSKAESSDESSKEGSSKAESSAESSKEESIKAESSKAA